MANASSARRNHTSGVNFSSYDGHGGVTAKCDSSMMQNYYDARGLGLYDFLIGN